MGEVVPGSQGKALNLSRSPSPAEERSQELVQAGSDSPVSGHEVAPRPPGRLAESLVPVAAEAEEGDCTGLGILFGSPHGLYCVEAPRGQVHDRGGRAGLQSSEERLRGGGGRGPVAERAEGRGEPVDDEEVVPRHDDTGLLPRIPGYHSVSA